MRILPHTNRRAAEIATLFLEKNLNVRRFTTQATRIIKLIPGDVVRPITDLLYPELTTDAREVLRKLGFAEKPVTTLFRRTSLGECRNLTTSRS